MDFSFSDLNFNSVENLPGFEARAAFLCYGKALRDDPVNSASVFREDVDIVPIVVDDSLSYILWRDLQDKLAESEVIGLPLS